MMNCKDCEGHGWNEDTRGNMIVCKRCAGTGITLHPGDLAALARANGYVKLEPGQVVVQVEDLARIVTWFRGDARTVPHADMDTTLNRFAAAIDAAKGGWK